VRLLNARAVLAHPFVTDEIALSGLSNRSSVLGDLNALPQSVVASDGEVLHFIDSNALYGRGIGYVDAHLLASVMLSGAAELWTADERLLRIAEDLGFAADSGF
jgi:hypothetical protein